MDLVVALASGAAGGFAVSRAKVSDALPGVAIAISLVPPLCVVGVMLANGDPDAAFGALLLFLTNFLAILAAGGGMLALMGYGRVSLGGVSPANRRKASIAILAATAVVLIPLVVTSVRVARDSLVEYEVRTYAENRLPDGAALLEVTVIRDEVDILVDTAGRADRAGVEIAAQRLHDLHPELTVRLRLQDNILIEIPAE